MDQTQIKNHILLSLYNAFFLSDENFNLKSLAEREGWQKTGFWNLVDRMKNEALIRGTAVGGFYEITSRGVIYAEDAGLVNEALVLTNQKARTLILKALMKVYEEKGNLYSASMTDLYEQTGLDESVLKSNRQVLLGLDYIEATGNARFKITEIGIDAVIEYRQLVGLVDEFKDISEMSPRPRGRALQKFLAKIIGQHGWGQDEGVRTSNEEMDVIVFRDREYYLFECKWEKERVEAAVVRELFGKLSNRVDVRGIVVSMSGFTEGAVKQVEDYIGQRVILLFGSDDVQQMADGRATFDELLNAKYKELVTRRKVSFC
jgi:hypothetical protein